MTQSLKLIAIVAIAAGQLFVGAPALEIGQEFDAPSQEIADALMAQGYAQAAPAPAKAPVAPPTKAERIAATITQIEKRIVSDTSRLVELKAELERGVNEVVAQAGDTIVARITKGGEPVTALVLGVKVAENGQRRLKVITGSGVDTEIAIIFDTAIQSVTQVAAVAA